MVWLSYIHIKQVESKCLEVQFGLTVKSFLHIHVCLFKIVKYEPISVTIRRIIGESLKCKIFNYQMLVEKLVLYVE